MRFRIVTHVSGGYVIQRYCAGLFGQGLWTNIRELGFDCPQLFKTEEEAEKQIREFLRREQFVPEVVKEISNENLHESGSD